MGQNSKINLKDANKPIKHFESTLIIELHYMSVDYLIMKEKRF